MPKILRQIWYDPVGSRVIGGIITALLISAVVAALHFDWWPRLFRYPIPLWLVILMIVVGLVGTFILRRGKQIEIVGVWQSGEVAFEQVICGVTRDPSLPIELRVYAGNEWHKQWKVEVNGRRWCGKCRFGDSAEQSAGQKFRLVAIAPKTPLANKVRELPDDAIKSEIVAVIRSL